MKNAYMKKSKSDNWATPRYLFEETCKQFNVFPDLDVCASEFNRKCWNYFDKKTDGLKQQWDQTFYMLLFLVQLCVGINFERNFNLRKMQKGILGFI